MIENRCFFIIIDKIYICSGVSEGTAIVVLIALYLVVKSEGLINLTICKGTGQISGGIFHSVDFNTAVGYR